MHCASRIAVIEAVDHIIKKPRRQEHEDALKHMMDVSESFKKTGTRPKSASGRENKPSALCYLER